MLSKSGFLACVRIRYCKQSLFINSSRRCKETNVHVCCINEVLVVGPPHPLRVPLATDPKVRQRTDRESAEHRALLREKVGIPSFWPKHWGIVIIQDRVTIVIPKQYGRVVQAQRASKGATMRVLCAPARSTYVTNGDWRPTICHARESSVVTRTPNTNASLSASRPIRFRSSRTAVRVKRADLPRKANSRKSAIALHELREHTDDALFLDIVHTKHGSA